MEEEEEEEKSAKIRNLGANLRVEFGRSFCASRILQRPVCYKMAEIKLKPSPYPLFISLPP